VHQQAGLARYAERLAVHLRAAGGGDLDLRLFHNAHSGHPVPATLPGLPVVALPLNQYGWRLSALASQLVRQTYWPIQRCLTPATPGSLPAVYHATEHLLPRLATPTVLTVHDLIFERYPEHHTWRNRTFLRVGMRLFTQAATAIIAVSEHTRRDLMALYDLPAAKIHVVYEGVDPAFAPASPDEIARVHARYSPERPYLLMVGTLEPRKNHAAALRALARLKAWGLPHRLVIAGGSGWLFAPIRQQVAALGLDDDVTFAGYVPAGDLSPLYAGAACVLAPSLYEGFGFPVLEAMACGAPVVGSDISSLPEVAGDAALLVAPQDDAALAAAIHLVLTQPGLAAQLREKGLRRAARFRWATCAAETLEIYRLAAGGR
jgi:glycosyltransferase involved in cell wall biosynthesis